MKFIIRLPNSSGEISAYNDWKIRYGSVEYNNADNVTLAGSKKNDSIRNYYSEGVLITGRKGNDALENYRGNNVTISGGNGRDSITNNNGTNVTIFGGAGRDYVNNWADNVFISGDSGKDTIEGWGNNVTISGGKGNDYIDFNGENNIVKYASSDGNDTISGFDSDDILHITKGSYKTSVSGNDVIVTVGEGKIRLKDAKGQQISIKNSKGKIKTKTYGAASSALIAENNFATTDNLSSIVKNNLAATDYKLDSQNFENLSQEKLITFSTK